MAKIYIVTGRYSGRAFYQNCILTWCGSEGDLAMKPVDMANVTSVRPQTDEDIRLMMKWVVDTKKYS